MVCYTETSLTTMIELDVFNPELINKFQPKSADLGNGIEFYRDKWDIEPLELCKPRAQNVDYNVPPPRTVTVTSKPKTTAFTKPASVNRNDQKKTKLWSDEPYTPPCLPQIELDVFNSELINKFQPKSADLGNGIEFYRDKWDIEPLELCKPRSQNADYNVPPPRTVTVTSKPKTTAFTKPASVNRNDQKKQLWSDEPYTPPCLPQVVRLCPEDLFERKLQRILVQKLDMRFVRYMATLQLKGELVPVTLKSLNGSNRGDFQDTLEALYREAMILTHLKDLKVSPYIHGIAENPVTQLDEIVTEYIPPKTLDQIKHPELFTRGNWVYLCKQLAGGLKEVHKKGVLINNIRPDTVVIIDNRVCFSDLSSASFNEGYLFNSSQQKTLFTAPELLKFGESSMQSDIFSLGALYTYLAFLANLPELHYIAALCTAESPNDRPTAAFLSEVLLKFLH